MKKISILVVTMLAIFSITAFASEVNTTLDEGYTPINVLKAMGIYKENGDKVLSDNDTLTRAEAAALMVRTLDKESLASFSAKVVNFKDMTKEHWANGYINVATSAKIITGYEDDTIRPDQKITYGEFITMVLRLLGGQHYLIYRVEWIDEESCYVTYEYITKDLIWYKNAMEYAYKRGLISEKLEDKGDEFITKKEALEICYKVLNMRTWKLNCYDEDYTGDYFVLSDNTLVEDKLELKILKDAKIKLYDHKYKKIYFYSREEKNIIASIPSFIDIKNLNMDLDYEVWINEKNEVVNIFEKGNDKK